jgi:hypothetical protein
MNGPEEDRETIEDETLTIDKHARLKIICSQLVARYRTSNHLEPETVLLNVVSNKKMTDYEQVIEQSEEIGDGDGDKQR